MFLKMSVPNSREMTTLELEQEGGGYNKEQHPVLLSEPKSDTVPEE
jgi:hypothetical protein